jgi:hypothetical protein
MAEMPFSCKRVFPREEKCLLDHLSPFGTSCSLSFSLSIGPPLLCTRVQFHHKCFSSLRLQIWPLGNTSWDKCLDIAGLASLTSVGEGTHQPYLSILLLIIP